MYIRSSVLLSVAVLVTVATAAPTELEARAATSQCITGPIQCCTNTYNQTDQSLITLFAQLGINPPTNPGLVGFGCTPIIVPVTGTGATCAQQPVCCIGNTFNGLINDGCNIIIINA